MSTPAHRSALERTLVLVCNTLLAADVRFALTGGAAVYARGGPFSDHDVDVLVKPDTVDAAVRALVQAGMRATDAPEDWLRKVYDGAVPVDLIFRPADLDVTDAMLARAELLPVSSSTAPVSPATDVVAHKLLSLHAHHCDYSWVLPAARSLREQIDWADLRSRTEHSPYAAAFLFLADRLGLTTGGEPDQYLLARIHRALAEDPRTVEQAVQVELCNGEVLVTGQVTGAALRAAITAVIREQVPDLAVDNRVTLVPVGEPDGHEELA